MLLNLIRTIIFSVGLFYVLRFLVRVFSADRRRPSPASSKQASTPRPASRKASRYADNEGDFVDYEEIKD